MTIIYRLSIYVHLNMNYMTCLELLSFINFNSISQMVCQTPLASPAQLYKKSEVNLNFTIFKKKKSCLMNSNFEFTNKARSKLPASTSYRKNVSTFYSAPPFGSLRLRAPLLLTPPPSQLSNPTSRHGRRVDPILAQQMGEGCDEGLMPAFRCQRARDATRGECQPRRG
jgi:hypothetical protein